jgi:hypothetical protein
VDFDRVLWHSIDVDRSLFLRNPAI